MKKLIVLMLAITLINCESDSMKQLNAVKNELDKASAVSADTSEVKDAMDDSKDRVTVLKTLTPFSQDSFVQWLPETLNGLPLKSDDYTDANGAVGTAQYANEDKDIQLVIKDGAGPLGKNKYQHQMASGNMVGATDVDDDFMKQATVAHNGVPTFEAFYKNEKKAFIKTIYEDRFVVEATAHNMTVEDLYVVIDALDYQNLN